VKLTSTKMNFSNQLNNNKTLIVTLIKSLVSTKVRFKLSASGLTTTQTQSRDFFSVVVLRRRLIWLHVKFFDARSTVLFVLNRTQKNSRPARRWQVYHNMAYSFVTNCQTAVVHKNTSWLIYEETSRSYRFYNLSFKYFFSNIDLYDTTCNCSACFVVLSVDVA